MKKTVSLLLVLVLIVAMAIPAMALNVPDDDADTGTVNGYTYSCYANAGVREASATMAYDQNKTTISIGVTFERARVSDSDPSTYSDAERGYSSISYSYYDNAYRITHAVFGFAVGTSRVHTSEFN